MKIASLFPVALALSAIPLSTAFAAGPAPGYNIGGALKEAAPPAPPVEKERAVPNLPEPEAPPLILSGDETLFVRDFRLNGAEFADPAELAGLLAPYREQNLSLARIYEAANKITTFYRDCGYLVAKAYVPQQDARDGILTIRVIVGRYGQMSLENPTPVMDFLVGGPFEDAMEGGAAPVRRDALERAMLLTSDLPGMRMPKLTIAPGTAPGTTDFVIEAQPGKRVEGYLLGDNYGSRFTGRKRAQAGVAVNSPFSLGDRLSLDAMSSPAAGLQSGRAAYSFPIGTDGLRAELAAARTTYKLGDSYEDVEAEGHADTAEGALTYPVIRTEAESLHAFVSMGAKRLQDKAWGETTSYRRAMVSRWGMNNETSGSLFGLDATTSATATYTLGRIVFSDDAERIANEAGPHTAGNFQKVELGLGGSIALADGWKLSNSLKAQKAIGKNLDSSEQMSISGMGAVLAYPEGIMADNGYLYNAELKYALPGFIEQYQHALGFFIDTGRVYIEDSGYTTTPHSYRISDAGIAYYARYEYSDERYLIAGLKLVEGIGPKPWSTEATQRTKLLAQIGLTF